MNYQEKINALYQEQSQNWNLLRRNLEGLKSARTRKFSFDGFSMYAQFNPERILSSAAKVDKDSINKRKCFLCEVNRPPEQKKVLYEEKYEFLCNPYPIFKKHFTLSHIEHNPQEISVVFTDFLNISKDLPDLVVFYNAPSCGASAPDHLHFQAGNMGLMPIESELSGLLALYGSILIEKDSIKVFSVDDGLRRFILIESDRQDVIEESFQHIHEMSKGFTDSDEPMLNILSYYRNGKWQVLIFLREKHRPWQYFEEGMNNILLSPASVDYGGTLITPLEKDFMRIKKEDIISIFEQTSLSADKFELLKAHIKNVIHI
ncbi:MAG: DUF4922 domain-containing protein [Bacteroidales bacterium]